MYMYMYHTLYTSVCIMVYEMRTNIEIDDELVAKVMERYRLATKRAAVDFALRRLVRPAMTREEMLAMEGSGWGGDLDAMRAPDPVLEDWLRGSG
jgi:Arc/MetJ family transcription regulator